MLFAGLQVLSEHEHVHVGGAHVCHRLEDLVVGLAEAEVPTRLVQLTAPQDQLERVHQLLRGGDPATVVQAVRDAVETRLRPIAMSTLTTVFGLAPLVFLAGEGTELYRGVGVIVLFGLLGTAIVTLTFLPALTVMVLAALGSSRVATIL